MTRCKIVTILFPLSPFIVFWMTVTLAASTNENECASYKSLLDQVSCYASLAKTTNNLAPCDQAEHKGVRYQCYAIFAEHITSPDICHKIPSYTEEHRSLIDVCLSDVALKAEDPIVCESIIASGIQDSCYLKLYEKSGNKALCEKIDDDGLKSICTGKPVIIE